jgi:hypothetical protein
LEIGLNFKKIMGVLELKGNTLKGNVPLNSVTPETK